MNKRIAVIGGGIGGLCTGLALQKQGIEVSIYEKQGQFHGAGAGIVLGGNALRALDYLGVGEQIREASFSTNQCTIYSELGKKLTVLDYKSDSLPNYTFIHRHDLVKILAEAIEPSSVIYNKKLVQLVQRENYTIQLCFEDGSEEQTNFLIASDGIHSFVRKQLLPHKQLRFAGYTCWRGIIENCPDSIPKAFTETWGPKGRFGIVPLSNNRIYWYALKNGQANDSELTKWKVKDLLYNFMAYHDPIPRVLERTDDKNVIRHDIYDLDPLFRYNFGNIILLGDAAHATTPNMGQGACQAIEDALSLALCFEKEKEINNVFIKYEEQRLDRSRKIIQESRLAGKIAQIDIPFLCSIRNQMLKLTPSTVYHSRLKNLFEIQTK
ncbi:FAD-dependent monooxygenase [Bacillus sp. 31A1R]|uniref:FAD-dependent monooxygenase n=1 Tax=Robertmurraya mangrovi TaxID=3098077 RepID=A0ABU5IYB9_9BACI|nr:FAD-dependent monooxygenase [Bacillus sp. 31A1R]MDZ5472087.1 FAD-dependent monooxygenase [Bacillus sp. 31A1R]